jgi:High-affinity nickel-transport protein
MARVLDIISDRVTIERLAKDFRWPVGRKVAAAFNIAMKHGPTGHSPRLALCSERYPSWRTHGLEPGHSKTMMAALIVAIRGTVAQAILLGLAATISHTLVIWVSRLAECMSGKDIEAESFEPYLQLVSAVITILIAVWMIWRTSRQRGLDVAGHSHHGYDHDEAPVIALLVIPMRTIASTTSRGRFALPRTARRIPMSLCTRTIFAAALPIAASQRDRSRSSSLVPPL